jgi:hypothetical protein
MNASSRSTLDIGSRRVAWRKTEADIKCRQRNLYPGQNLSQRLVAALSIELENPHDWDPSEPSDPEEKSRILNLIRNNMSDPIDLYCREVLVRDPRTTSWLPANCSRGNAANLGLILRKLGKSQFAQDCVVGPGGLKLRFIEIQSAICGDKALTQVLSVVVSVRGNEIFAAETKGPKRAETRRQTGT